MAFPLQKTKLFLPAPRAQLVERPRLIARLNELPSEGCRAAVITASAGSGKTTLVVQWLHQLGWPVGWVSLDGRDSTPQRFFAYVIAALQSILPGSGADAAALLDLPGASMEEVVTVLSNDLAGAPGPFILALDDYHTITSPAVHQALDLLLDAEPPQMRLVLLSREDPALQLARRRARGQVVELRQDDLRFSLAEALDFMNQVMGLRLTVSQAKALETRTEGWIAGLQMAALSLQRAADPDQFITGFSGSHQFILDYLMEEVLAGQSGEIQRFLLETSILDRMCADLCAALTGKRRSEAQQMLEHLAKANLFVIPLDEERAWYRYHHLFNDLLLARLQNQAGKDLNILYRRASDWYEDNGDARLAVEFALKAGDMERAADLVERHMAERWRMVDFEFFLLTNRLPPELVRERPSLSLQTAWTCVITGQNERILPLVDAAESRLSAPGWPDRPQDESDRAFARCLRAYVADLDNQPVELGSWMETAYAAIDEDNTGMKNSVAVVLGTICHNEADFDGALRYFNDALERDKRVGGTNAVPIAATRIATTLRALARINEAERLLRENIDYIKQRGNRRYYISGSLNVSLAEILLERNQLDEARSQLREGLRLLDDWPVPASLGMGATLLARYHAVQGDLEGARTALARAEELHRQVASFSEFTTALDRARIVVWTAGGDRGALEQWARENSPAASGLQHFRFEARKIELCRAWLVLGRGEEAAELLERIEPLTKGRPGRRLSALVLLAVASKDPRRRLASLDEALRTAASQNYLRLFLECGAPMRQVLEKWLESGPSKDAALSAYARIILAAFGGPAHLHAKIESFAGLPEPLSEREVEVLALAAEGLTNQQIAARLVISIRTVKKHIENINGKLGAQNRTQAAARARELGFLKE